MMMVPSYKARQEREAERQRDRETERQRHRETETQRHSETAAIGPRRLAGPFKTSGSGASERRVVGALDE